MTNIHANTLQFLRDIAQNNQRDWFNEHKDAYESAKQNMETFMQALMERLNATDVIASYHLYRIYRDIRFSKDKTPYKTYFHAYLKREGASRRGGYWVGIEPNHTQIGGGFYGPEKHDLQRVRMEFQAEPKRIQQILSDRRFVETFGSLQGDALKKAPKGFEPSDENIELIRMKQWYAMRAFSDKEVLAPDFLDKCVATFVNIRPFFDYMSEVLTTNLNGESII
ncbi:MAG: DUF2461 domain-containing protein [Chitinophagales bacterium]|nr:DUF2461 domain-containing protein [Bacteroidota bacterium]MCB9042413.1 DUF2461 domain-containing protein [Chitinophagales bacterium]